MSKQEPLIRTLGVVSRFSFRCIRRESIAVPSGDRYFCFSCRKAPARIGWGDQDRTPLYRGRPSPLFTELPRRGLHGNRAAGATTYSCKRAQPRSCELTFPQSDRGRRPGQSRILQRPLLLPFGDGLEKRPVPLLRPFYYPLPLLTPLDRLGGPETATSYAWRDLAVYTPSSGFLLVLTCLY